MFFKTGKLSKESVRGEYLERMKAMGAIKYSVKLPNKKY